MFTDVLFGRASLARSRFSRPDEVCARETQARLTGGGGPPPTRGGPPSAGQAVRVDHTAFPPQGDDDLRHPERPQRALVEPESEGVGLVLGKLQEVHMAEHRRVVLAVELDRSGAARPDEALPVPTQLPPAAKPGER